MMLLFLHGPAKNASREKLLEVKQKFDQNNVVVYEEGSDMQTILGGLSTGSLFSEQQLIILENPAEDFVPDSSLITFNSSLVLWFDHEVNEKKPVMEWIKKNKGQVLNFPESREVSVFPFLDFLADGKSNAFVEIKKLKDAGFDVHYLITMVFYLLRNLVAVPSNAPDFVKRKLIKQRTRFDIEKFKNLYNATRFKTRSDVIASYYKEIIEIDFKIKSGYLEKPQAEFLLVNKFLSL